ncbi:hypothetical protein EDD22DRAFT_951631 [Suillus occidentalis]|nr:hypothetical protein EDD22DRAFT_951631 [Suillus occidentalis]
MDVEDSHPHDDARDLVQSIEGMYRVLDLISEQGSGGLVDKIIIAQDSLRAFTNTICPGSYVSTTKVKFSALDALIVKPIGVYGSKEEIVRLLLSLGVVDDYIAAQLVVNHCETSVPKPSLRSGLYIVRSDREITSSEQLFVIYWPEDATWDDSAPSSVKRNRVTFMRYLTTICDQIMALVSPKHARSIARSEQEGKDTVTKVNDDKDEAEDEPDRMFTFEVRKTNEQEEAVKSRPGFKATSVHIAMPQPHPEATEDFGLHKPRLLHGETTQGFMMIKYLPARRITDVWRRRPITRLQLGNWLHSDKLQVKGNLDANTVHLLLGAGLQNRFPQLCKQWQEESADISSNARATKASTEASIKTNFENNLPLLVHIFHWGIDPVKPATTSSTPAGGSSTHSTESEQASPETQDQLSTIIKLYPEIEKEFRHTLQRLRIEKINSRDFKNYKQRVYIAECLLHRFPDVDMEDESFLDVILYEDMRHVKESIKMLGQHAVQHQPKGLMTVWSSINSFISSGPGSQFVDKTFKDAEAAASLISDTQFLAGLDDRERFPVMKKVVAGARAAALVHFRLLLATQMTTLAHSSLRIQIDESVAQAHKEITIREEQQLAESRERFIAGINAHSQTGHHSHVLLIDAIEDGRPFYYHATSSVHISGSRESLEEPKLECTVHTMQLTTQDLHSLQLDSSTIPEPKFTKSFSFSLLLGYSVVRAQLLQGEKILLAITDRLGNLTVYLEHLTAIEGALTHSSRGKKLNRDKIGDYILAFDESKCILSVVATEKLFLHIFVFDDTLGFQANGSAINLTQWYPEGSSINHACFICGGEELLLVDTLAQARVYSLTTMQFRPATLNLNQIPTAVYSSPDGSCLITAHVRGPGLALTAYHWSTFGSTDGIPLEIHDLPLDQPLLLTSLTSRNIVHLITLDINTQSCRSIALDITRKVTEFTFKEKGTRGGNAKPESVAAHNCLIDCHAEVWTRFPVLPAIWTITHSYRTSMILFQTLKGCQRSQLEIFSRESLSLQQHTLLFVMITSTGAEWNVSKFCAGEWLAEFLCLIPIQIAVTKENRFVPLKDGVYSTELEKSLLGADVNRIVDYVSFGWYESLFQSYMAKKPVKVVSSMGEQSVGKSFSLNHLVDTSFAGSAMRTTEGVWMSVTPTRDTLVVALDFEGKLNQSSTRHNMLISESNQGVHSIERSAQEDTLLVLFNTAISNLVLFRNNFALSRDITGLFQSFQSSATVLDPAANPSLFQSTLAIIIKDVVDSDKADIAKEHFQKIVQDEQEANFISRLHAGQLNIIPWPVIESQEFYQLFPALKRRLDKQRLTHKTAGEFLHTVKTLMAKLKANDWGALSQSMASHRAQLLLSRLPNALAFGLQEVHPDPEPLKNFLWRGLQSPSREAALQVLSHAWGDYDSRHHMPEDHWIENLIAHIDSMVNLRVAHVREWISSNVARFQSGQASIDELMRTFESAIVDLKSHPQQEHETRHGSMSSSRWAVDGPDDTGLEVEGRRFSSNDEGAPMMCNLVCQALGRHVHIDHCRSEDATACLGNNEAQHIFKRLLPHADRPKDFLTHNLFWRRSGFKDPYSREEQTNFAKCDAMCSGPEHTTAEGSAAQPSFCTLPLFHVPMEPNNDPATLGYVSNDGHFFACRNPVVMQQAFHVIFVADRSSSMKLKDRQPLRNTPASDRIIQRSNNRFGAVLSSLYGFWSARAAAVAGRPSARRDSYSIILFDQSAVDAVVNDFSSSPDQLLDAVLRHNTSVGTNFTAAIQRAQSVMELYWSTERTPVVIFLSDGQCPIENQAVQDLCRAAVRLGRALSFHSVSFGQNKYSATLRTMFQIALEIQNNAPQDALGPAAVPSSYTNALDTVQLAETFLGIASSLTKPRGALIH